MRWKDWNGGDYGLINIGSQVRRIEKLRLILDGNV